MTAPTPLGPDNQYTWTTGDVQKALDISPSRLRHMLNAENPDHLLDWERDERGWRMFTPASVRAERERRAKQPGYFKTPPGLGE